MKINGRGVTGQGMIEYALILGLLAIIVLVGVYSFGPAVVDLYENRVASEQDAGASISATVYR